jgi:hypothetical protein
VDQETGISYPFYPIPDEAITEPHWIEGGAPGNVDLRDEADRHLLILDGDNRHLYELFNVFFDGAQWHAGSGAFFDLSTNGRRRIAHGRPPAAEGEPDRPCRSTQIPRSRQA